MGLLLNLLETVQIRLIDGTAIYARFRFEVSGLGAFSRCWEGGDGRCYSLENGRDWRSLPDGGKEVVSSSDVNGGNDRHTRQPDSQQSPDSETAVRGVR